MSRTLQEQLRALAAQVNEILIPSGVIVWAPHEQLPNGISNTDSMSQLSWQAAFALLAQGALIPGWVGSAYALKAAVRDLPQDGPVPLAITRYDYASPRRRFTKAVRQAMASGSPLPNPPDCVTDILKQRKAFMISCVLPDQWGESQPKVRARIFQLHISREFYSATPGLPAPDELRIDVGEGEQPTCFGDLVTCRVISGDSLSVTVRARYGAEWLVANCIVGISDTPAAPRPDEIWPLSVPGGLSGRAAVYRSTRVGEKRHYWIMAEGFPGGFPHAYLYDNLNQHDLLRAALAAGYDLIAIGFDAGALSVQANAEVVIECIKRANATGSDHVVGGVSMGGMTTRYALLLMEQRNMPHQTSMYLSIDTPHRGSRTSIAVQWFAHYFKTAAPGMADQVALLNSPANQQFLPQWYNDGKVTESELRKRLYQEYEMLGGYPKLKELYAVASGCGDGQSAIAPSSTMVEWSADPFGSVRLYSQADTDVERVIAEGHWFLADGSEPEQLDFTSGCNWDGVPGSLDVYNQLVGGALNLLGFGKADIDAPMACVVPTVSALDLDMDPTQPIPAAVDGNSPFHDYVCANRNLSHIETSVEIKNWIIEKLITHLVSDSGDTHG